MWVGVDNGYGISGITTGTGKDITDGMLKAGRDGAGIGVGVGRGYEADGTGGGGGGGGGGP